MHIWDLFQSFGGLVLGRSGFSGIWGGAWLPLSWEACSGVTWVHMEVLRFLRVSCVPGGWGSEPFTQEAHRYQDLRVICGEESSG